MELPLTHPEYYEEMGIKPPKGVILYGSPGTGTVQPNIHVFLKGDCWYVRTYVRTYVFTNVYLDAVCMFI